MQRIEETWCINCNQSYWDHSYPYLKCPLIFRANEKEFYDTKFFKSEAQNEPRNKPTGC